MSFDVVCDAVVPDDAGEDAGKAQEARVEGAGLDAAPASLVGQVLLFHVQDAIVQLGLAGQRVLGFGQAGRGHVENLAEGGRGVTNAKSSLDK